MQKPRAFDCRLGAGMPGSKRTPAALTFLRAGSQCNTWVPTGTHPRGRLSLCPAQTGPQAPHHPTRPPPAGLWPRGTPAAAHRAAAGCARLRARAAAGAPPPPAAPAAVCSAAGRGARPAAAPGAPAPLSAAAMAAAGPRLWAHMLTLAFRRLAKESCCRWCHCPYRPAERQHGTRLMGPL
jgi:hypothetical protein